jgi:uncharacterized protein YvpB
LAKVYSQTISFETTYNFAQLYNPDSGTQSTIENLEFSIIDVAKIYFSGSQLFLRLKNGNTVIFDNYNDEGQFSEFISYYYDPQGETLSVIDLISNNFKIFPNPTENIFSISYLSQSSEPYKCNIYDVSGKIVMRLDMGIKNGNFIEMISTEKLKSGIYFVQLTSGSYSSFKKLIKK